MNRIYLGVNNRGVTRVQTQKKKIENLVVGCIPSVGCGLVECAIFTEQSCCDLTSYTRSRDVEPSYDEAATTTVVTVAADASNPSLCCELPSILCGSQLTVNSWDRLRIDVTPVVWV